MLPGDSGASAAAELYSEMLKIAAVHLSRGLRSPSIQPTVLVHEAWLRLNRSTGWMSKTHFLALASRTMRNIMIDAARARLAQKRQQPDGMEFGEPGQTVPFDQVIEVDRVLNQLSHSHSRKAQVVELRFFGGLDFDEIAEALGVSVVTAKRDWEFARVWMFSRLNGNAAGPRAAH